MTTTRAEGAQCRRRVVEPRLGVEGRAEALETKESAVATAKDWSKGNGGGGAGWTPAGGCSSQLREATTMLLQCWPLQLLLQC